MVVAAVAGVADEQGVVGEGGEDVPVGVVEEGGEGGGVEVDEPAGEEGEEEEGGGGVEKEIRVS